MNGFNLRNQFHNKSLAQQMASTLGSPVNGCLNPWHCLLQPLWLPDVTPMGRLRQMRSLMLAGWHTSASQTSMPGSWRKVRLLNCWCSIIHNMPFHFVSVQCERGQAFRVVSWKCVNWAIFLFQKAWTPLSGTTWYLRPRSWTLHWGPVADSMTWPAPSASWRPWRWGRYAHAFI